ncbi:hypothetical protein C8R41DRAFT_914422 [Lentinula lateritia]|uniref:Uncharacterized protein n=1 Tax=Lentinula lateritia TaxID=40482 RepID=A0ABQ8VVF2_9AGAR|nr:hypothetical protein C8R41DRAFT_914422 [Lentinula lateritia]
MSRIWREREYFQHVITGLSMKPLHLNLGGFNGGIYKLSALDSEFEDENRAGPGHVIKLVDLHQEYADFHPNNVHVVLKLENKRITVVGVRLLDFGYPGVHTTTELPPEKKFRAWFDLRFDLLWNYVYELLGEKPPHYMKYVALIEGEILEVDDPSVKM